MKKELTDSFWNFPGIPYPHRQNRKRMMSTVLMVNFTHICKKYLFYPWIYSWIYSYSLLSYIRTKIKNLVCIASKQKYFDKLTRKSIHWYSELLNMFLNRCSYKNNCFIELAHNFSVLVLMIRSFKVLLKGLALDFFIVLRTCC